MEEDEYDYLTDKYYNNPKEIVRPLKLKIDVDFVSYLFGEMGTTKNNPVIILEVF